MANEPNLTGHVCDKRCFMCDRPNDVFMHLHMVPKMVGMPSEQVPDDADAIVLCIPCIAGLSQGLSSAIHAYVAGGYAFDKYAHDRLRSSRQHPSQGQGMHVPKWLRQQFGEDDDNA